MDAFDRALTPRRDDRAPPERLPWLSQAPPRVGLSVRDADGVRIGTVCDLIHGEGGSLLAVAIASVKTGRVRRVGPEALRAYGDGLVCCFFRAEIEQFPHI